MSIKTEAIVLTKTKYGDNSFIVNLYSYEYGRFATIIKIPKSRNVSLKSNLFFPLNIIETEVDFKNTRNVQILKYCNRLFVLNDISCDVFKSCIAQFIVEVVSKTVKEEEHHSNLYMLLKNTILLLEEMSIGVSNIHLVFLKEFLKTIGFEITNNFSDETPYFNFKEGQFLSTFYNGEESLNICESKYLSDVLNIDYVNISVNKLSYNIRKSVLHSLLAYYKIHILGSGDIKSLKVLNEVFSG